MAAGTGVELRPNVPIGGYIGNGLPNQPAAPKPQYGSPASFAAAVDTQGRDYDTIMSDYDKLLDSTRRTPTQTVQFSPIAPQQTKYETSPGMQQAMSMFQSMAQSGGYDPSGIAAIRARSISPIRSIYANAQRNIDRQKNLQGGYSPNYTAATSKMAREMSEQIGQANTNVEATIAKLVQEGKLAALPGYANLAATESNNMNAFAQRNADIINETNRLNAANMLEVARLNSDAAARSQQGQLQIIEGKRGLYGTTPALVNTFGNQVAQAANMQQQQAPTFRNNTDYTRYLLDQFGRPVFG